MAEIAPSLADITASHLSRHNGIIRRLAPVACLLSLAVPACARLGNRVLDNHEAFATVAARNMVDSGDWVNPRFAGKPRLNKTPLGYWLTAVTAELVGGGEVNETTSRLPSLLAGLIAVAAVYMLAQRSFGRSGGYLSAGLLATSLGVIRYSTNARPEMVMAALVTVCYAAFWMGLRSHSRRRQVAWFVLFWASLGLGNLAKGPVPFLAVLPPLAVFLIVTRQWRKVRLMLPIAGPAIVVAILAPWPALLMLRLDHPLESLRTEVMGHLTANGMSQDADDFNPFYYLQTLALLTTPWWLFLPGALASPFVRRMRRLRQPLLLAWLWLVVTAVLFTVAAEKRQHYILPALPAAAILMGAVADDLLIRRHWLTRRLAMWVVGTMAVGGAIVAAATGLVLATVDYWQESLIQSASIPREFVAWSLSTLTWGLGVMALWAAVMGLAWRWVAVGRGRSAAVCILVAAALAGTAYGLGEGRWDLARDYPSFGRQLSSRIPPDSHVYVLGALEPRTLHYFGRDCTQMEVTPENVALLQGILQQDTHAVAITERVNLALLQLGDDLELMAAMKAPTEHIGREPTPVVLLKSRSQPPASQLQ